MLRAANRAIGERQDDIDGAAAEIENHLAGAEAAILQALALTGR